ncbi:23215_t:CDS:2 [Cetraspora pellucida]|uniref:23215_t:CDS:1 n=1 Tax=Cetraspora pellucida TaxID=1433469 RepID=A0A9N8W884_9GLOM|nr:23215_t:CDS:2 [Cetraspora pellucida]
MPATSPTVRPSKSSIHLPNKDVLGRQGAFVTSTRNTNSMYSAQAIAVKESYQGIQNTSSEAKKKTPQRPITPSPFAKNTTEGNKPVSKKIIRSKDDSLSVPPGPTLKTGNSRPVTPHGAQPSGRPVTSKEKRPPSILKSDKKKLPQDTIKQSGSKSSVITQSVSPPAPTSAHATSHQASAHRRSHERVASPDKSLLEENRKLKRLLDEREEMLHEKEIELQDAADIIEALSARVEQFQRDNSLLREQLASSNSTSNLLSAISNNYQRIRGDSPNTISTSPSPTPTPNSSSFINPSSKLDVQPSLSPKTTSPPSVGKTTKIRDSDVDNTDYVKEASQPIPKIIEPINSVRPHSRILDKPMNPNLSPFSYRQEGIAGKRDLQFAKREAAVKDVIMEDSDESETDEFFDHNNDNIPNDQVESENEIDEDDEIGLPQDVLNLVEAEVYNKMSPRRLRRYRGDLNEPSTLTVEQSNVNSTEGSASGKNGQSVLSSSQQISLKVNGNVSNTTQQRSQPRTTFLSVSSKDHLSPTSYSHLHPHRDSMSSVTSDSSDDLGLSNNGSYSSSVTSSSINDDENGFSKQTPVSNPQSSSVPKAMASSQPTTGSLNKSKLNVLNALNSSSRVKNSGLASKLNSDIPSSDERCPTPVPHNRSNSSGRNVNDGHTSATRRISSSVDSYRSSSPSPALSHQRPSPNSGKNGLVRPVSQIVSDSKNRSPSTLLRQVTANRQTSSPIPSSNRSSTPARSQSPALTTSSRASTPVTESNHSVSSQPRRSRPNENVDPSIPRPPPPLPSPASDADVTTIQNYLRHYLRLIADYSTMDNPLKFYDLKGVIDEGSSAKVYTAHPLASIEDEVAVKIIPLAYSLEFIFNEIYVLKHLKHKNIVGYKESFLRWDGDIREVWFAMEKCARGDVTNRAGKITPREVSRITGEPTLASPH